MPSLSPRLTSLTISTPSAESETSPPRSTRLGKRADPQPRQQQADPSEGMEADRYLHSQGSHLLDSLLWHRTDVLFFARPSSCDTSTSRRTRSTSEQPTTSFKRSPSPPLPRDPPTSRRLCPTFLPTPPPSLLPQNLLRLLPRVLSPWTTLAQMSRRRTSRPCGGRTSSTRTEMTTPSRSSPSHHYSEKILRRRRGRFCPFGWRIAGSKAPLSMLSVRSIISPTSPPRLTSLRTAHGVRASHLKHISIRRNRISPLGAVALAIMIRDYPIASDHSLSTDLAALHTQPPPSNGAFEPGNSVTARQALQAPYVRKSGTGSPRSGSPVSAGEGEEGMGAAAQAERDAWRNSEARTKLRKQIDELPRTGSLLTLDVKSNDIRVSSSRCAWGGVG